MKVLQLTVHFSPNVGGVETHLLDLVYGLAKRKWEVFVLTYRPLVAKAPWKILEKKKNITILRLPWFPGLFYQLVSQPIVEFLYLVPGLFFVIPFVLLVQNPEVIHAHGLVAGFIAIFWGKIAKKKVIISTHSLYELPQHGLYFSFVKWMFSHSDRVLCLSNQSVDEIERLGVDIEKVKRFTYWIDLSIFVPQNKEKAKKQLGWDNKFVVLFVGRLVRIKGVRELLQASHILHKNTVIAIAGEGPLSVEVMEEANKKNSKVIFLHKISNDKLPLYYNAADLLIVPSTHEEGFGRVILESLACGTPVIGANRGAIPEAMDDTVGRLITITPENIANAVMQLEKDPTLVQKLSRSSHTYAMKRYGEKNIREIIKVYES